MPSGGHRQAATKASAWARLFDHGANDGVGARVAHAHDNAVPGHTHNRRYSGGGDGLQHGNCGFVAHEAMLHVNGYAVEALLSHDFGCEGRGNLQPAVKGCAALLPKSFESVGTHG